MSSEKKNTCFHYDAFGWCEYRTECRYSHDVEPHHVDVVFGVIDPSTVDIPNEVQFNFPEGGPMKKYHIKKRWRPKSVTPGDLVRLSVSQKKWPNKKQCVRIDNIMQRATHHHLRIKENDCLSFATYSSCDLEDQCKMKHESEYAPEQSFHLATVVTITPWPRNDSKQCMVSVNLIENDEEKSYYIPQSDLWHMNGARIGDFVIIQESQRVNLHHKNKLHYGRIAAVMGDAVNVSDAKFAIERKLKRGFLLLEEPGTKHRVTAFSIDNCSAPECKRIGIHAAAASLRHHPEKLDNSFTPLHMRNRENNSKDHFDIESIRFGLSLYVHSKCDAKEDPSPILTPVFVERDDCFHFREHDEKRYSTYMSDMWQAISKQGFPMNDIAQTLAAGLLVDFPNTWKERVVILKMKELYNKQITEFMSGQRGKFVIAKMAASEVKIRADEDIAIPWSCVGELKDQLMTSEAVQSEKLAFVLCAAKRATKDFWGDRADRYTMDVVQSDKLQDDATVTMTSPVWQTTSFVNQQIAMSMMLSSERSLLYSKDDLLGIIVSRLATPTLFKAVVRGLTSTKVFLQFRGIHGLRRGNKNVKLRCIFPSSSSQGSDTTADGYPPISPESRGPVQILSLHLKSVTSNQYCNSDLVHLTNAAVTAFGNAAIDAVRHPNELRHAISQLPADHNSPAPYQKCGNETMVTLSRGVELQLQAAANETSKLRLLRVGANCHLCLFHMRSPSNAFRCERRDTKEFITAEDMAVMKERIRQDCLKTRVLQNVNIQWKGCYYSGGTFRHPASKIATKHLLCIRKEIRDERSEVSFVWTCHGVVCEVTDESVAFMTTSLLQCRSPKDEDCAGDESGDTGRGFVVEIIDTTGDAAETAHN